MTAEPIQQAGADQYRSFLEAKRCISARFGFDVTEDEVNPILKPHQRACVAWAVRGGRRALFEAFGLGKTMQQLEVVRLVLKHLGGGRGLIVAPLGVRQEFRRDAEKLGIPITFVRRSGEVTADGIYLTNYESVRDGKLDPRLFEVASLDEASVLRGFGGTKTFREFMRLFDGLRFKFVATATPSPNEYIELLAYAAFLEIMDIGQAKTRFFKRDSTKADHLTLHAHKEREFWLWTNSWAIFLQRPSDLGFNDEGYDLPELDPHWHKLPSDHKRAGAEKDGQLRMLRNAAIGLVDAAREKRDSLDARIAKLMELRAEDPAAHRLIWHDLEAERLAIEAAIPGITTVYGSQDLEEREQAIIDFSEGRVQELAAKPVLAGSGCNFQRHCAWAIFLGIGFKFNDFIQAIHRIQRFLQTRVVRIDLIYTEAESEVRRTLERKWRLYTKQVATMSEIIRQYRLNETEMAAALTRSLGVDRIEVSGENYTLVQNDCVDETRRMADNSVDLIVTSIPFGNQYEYSAKYEDFGHTDNEAHFWRQMDYLTPELLRVLEPGRDAAIHVKDRITPGGINGLGFQTLQPFSDHCREHFERHGFAFLGRKTIVTDVVRENNSTYRLGWSEQCKDGTRMGCGVPEYLLLFRKPQTDRTKGYADKRVKKAKKIWRPRGCAPDCALVANADSDESQQCTCGAKSRGGIWDNPGGYSRAKWQLDAHSLTRSDGNRPVTSEDLRWKPAHVIYKLWKRHSLEQVYSFDQHVQIAETLDASGSLPSTFMLLPPHSWHPDVWTDVARMLTANTGAAAAGREQHLCPLQFDIADRVIEQMSMPGELVYDPFGGVFTVVARAIRMRRRGKAVELNPKYFLDGCAFVKGEEQKVSMPTLFDLLAAESEEETEEVAS